MITLTAARIFAVRTTLEAAFTSCSSGNSRARPMKTPVSGTEARSVPLRLETYPVQRGRSLSRASARGYREAERIPALAVVRKASKAAIVTAMYPSRPAVIPAVSATGAAELAS